MKYSMMTYPFAHQLGEKVDMVQVCKCARKNNLEAMDQAGLYGYPAGEIRKMADDYGLKIVCYTFGPDLNFPGSHIYSQFANHVESRFFDSPFSKRHHFFP